MSLPPRNPDEILRARGADTRPAARFEPYATEREADGWDIPEEQGLLRTEVTPERARSIITRNRSPDISFDRSINPYRGCEHGCIYCFARPSHAYLGLSPGLDFETRITAKPNAPELLAAEIGRRGYAVAPIAFGTNTDPYQPVEAKLGIMRGCLQVLHDWNHPVGLVTRGATVMRDVDLLGAMAARGQAMAGVSITTLDVELARQMEPRAPAPATRLRMIQALADAGVPVRVMVAPVIPVLTEHEMERIMQAARDAGARAASMIPIRLPLEVAPLFRDWLERHHPGKAAHVMARVQAMRGGRDNDPRFGSRMQGEGHEADLLHQRFRLARKRLGLDGPVEALDCSRFAPPPKAGDQLSLF
ncbi:DNA repair photolyase [Paracoccus thiocyanatus]|uniref:DNA repair photolyase n=1 Tax=Paracoccus thiocyanatus TaxID=34006 RepID=A0A1N6N510_9RHOB|nr:PA0069 family radical SAM protein [Paracoccus thiocyanatus]SIP87152.1 DNA repair photolyase [Paracoccus thiocyanatus]